jgi:predicted TIM-barrel fold metal-dependent hydrolase
MIESDVVVDAHFHHVPLSVFKTLDDSAVSDPEALRLQAKNRDPGYMASRANSLLRDLDATLRFMDTAGIDIAMLQMPSWSVAGLEICRMLNNGLAQVWRDVPKRFLPIATVPYVHGQSSLDELTRAREELGFKGVSILTSQANTRLDDPSLRAYFRKAAALGLVILVHPPTQAKGLWGGTTWNIDCSLSRQYENVKCFAEVLHGLLPEVDGLWFLFSHLGGGVPSFLGRIKSWYRPPPQAGIDTSHIEMPMSSWEFDEFGLSSYFDSLMDHCWFDMAGTGGVLAQVPHAMSVLRSDRLAFGTDYPHEFSRARDARAYLSGIVNLVPDPKTRAALLGGNVLSLFGFVDPD